MEGWSEVHTKSCNKNMKTSFEYAFGFTELQPVSIWSKQLHSISTKWSPYYTGIFNCFSQTYLPFILIFFCWSIKRICWDFSESNLHGLLNIFWERIHHSSFAIFVSEIVKCLANNVCDLPSHRNGTVKGQELPAPFYSMEQKKNKTDDQVPVSPERSQHHEQPQWY